ncbi:unnamed protein product [Adineta ricciae]|nr:unnamed protein product [Adineta ricciae]
MIRSCCKFLINWGGFYLFFSVIGFIFYGPWIIWGSIATAKYVKERQSQRLYDNTSCLLLNYTIHAHTCFDCSGEGCEYLPCYDENFWVSYLIHNGTLVNSLIFTKEEPTEHSQTQEILLRCGQSITCYQHDDGPLVDSNVEIDLQATFVYPNPKPKLNDQNQNIIKIQVIMARSVPAGSSHFPTVSCKLRAGNGQELTGYFLCNSGRNPAARNLPEPTQISTDPVAEMIDLGTKVSKSKPHQDQDSNIKTSKLVLVLVHTCLCHLDEIVPACRLMV